MDTHVTRSTEEAAAVHKQNRGMGIVRAREIALEVCQGRAQSPEARIGTGRITAWHLRMELEARGELQPGESILWIGSVFAKGWRRVDGPLFRYRDLARNIHAKELPWWEPETAPRTGEAAPFVPQKATGVTLHLSEEEAADLARDVRYLSSASRFRGGKPLSLGMAALERALCGGG